MAKINILRYTLMLFGALFTTFPSAIAQENQPVDSSRYDEVRSLVGFYEFMLNSIGSATSSTRDKEVIITQSYKKVFGNPDVQIEDDLVHDRKVITNKNVTAYLRDVDFFFQGIQFDFEDIKIDRVAKEGGDFYYLVAFENRINGITLEGEDYTSIKQRFIEINSDIESGDLKIVSVYSTKVSREKELQLWWTSLSYGWVKIFKSYVPFEGDSATNTILKRIANLDSLDLSGNQLIQNIEPLAALRNLKTLNISNTKINDLSPLRYARNLHTLKATNTPLLDVDALEYFEQLYELNLSESQVMDISALSRLMQLKRLNLSQTRIYDFSVFQQMTSLTHVNLANSLLTDPELLSTNTALIEADISSTAIVDLAAFKAMSQLTMLNVSETSIRSLEGLKGHPSLETLFINQTQIKNLTPLLGLPKLTKVYADQTGITEQAASTFMAQKSNTLVITNSEQIMKWWKSLPGNWQTVFSSIINQESPSKEQIIQLINIDSLDVSGQNLQNASPLLKFKGLKMLDISQNHFSDFSFTKDMKELTYLRGEELPVESTDGLDQNTQLQFLILTQSGIHDMKALSYLNQLELVDLDQTFVDESQVSEFLKSNPKTVVIYQSETLKNWWDSLTEDWKTIWSLKKVDTYHLHALIEQQEVSISNLSVSTLSPLNIFINLQKITLDRVSMTSLDELYVHADLRSLTCTNGPLQSLSGITQLKELTYLNISNTAIEDLKELDGLKSLKELNCSGTGISKMKGIEALYGLTTLNVSNTRIWRLDRLSDLENLQKLVCNNTRLRDFIVDQFKSDFPNCEVVYY